VKILLCHNYYRTRGGEDGVFTSEAALLRSRGHAVRTYTRDSRELDAMSLPGKARVVLQGFRSGRTLRDVSRLLSDDRPDVVHVHNVWPLISPALYVAAQRHKVPVVQTIHNFRFFCINGLLFRDGAPCNLCRHGSSWHGVRHRCLRGSAVYSAWYAAIQSLHRRRRTFRECIDRYIVLNRFAREMFIEAGFDPARIVLKPNAATVRAKYVVDDPAPLALFVGRLSSEKGVMTLLRAAAQVPELPLKIIGDGPLERAARAFIERHELTHIEMLGYQPPEAVEQHLARALVCVFTSECYENCPLVILNALCLGTPVIASRTGGLPDLVPEGKAGWLFEPGNHAALAERLHWIAAHQADAIALRPGARAWGASAFSEDSNYEKLMNIYRDTGAAG
jgi:glycosyltransferase involved in cell wall biosynthesis